jgi:hypothetical protein
METKAYENVNLRCGIGPVGISRLQWKEGLCRSWARQRVDKVRRAQDNLPGTDVAPTRRFRTHADWFDGEMKQEVRRTQYGSETLNKKLYIPYHGVISPWMYNKQNSF